MPTCALWDSAQTPFSAMTVCYVGASDANIRGYNGYYKRVLID